MSDDFFNNFVDAEPQQQNSPPPSDRRGGPAPRQGQPPQPPQAPIPDDLDPDAYEQQPRQEPPGRHQMAGPGEAPGVSQIRAGDLIKRHRERPTRGARKWLMASTFNTINPGQSKDEKYENFLISKADRDLRNPHRTAIWTIKGGVFKTPLTLGLGSAFAHYRNDRIIALDANPDRGNMVDRMEHPTVMNFRTLVNDPNIHKVNDVRAHTAKSSVGLEAVGSVSNLGDNNEITGDEYKQLLETVERFYDVILTDCGTASGHDVMATVFANTDQLIVPTTTKVDTASKARYTLEWLRLNGYEALAAKAIVVISDAHDNATKDSIASLKETFGGNQRRVRVVPYDPHIDEGTAFIWDRLQPATQRALLEIAADVSDGFAEAGGHR